MRLLEHHDRAPCHLRQLAAGLGAPRLLRHSRRTVQADRRFRDSTDAAEADLEALVKAGLGAWQTASGNEQEGRPTRVFQLSTVSTVNETQEKSRRVRIFVGSIRQVE